MKRSREQTLGLLLLWLVVSPHHGGVMGMDLIKSSGPIEFDTGGTLVTSVEDTFRFTGIDVGVANTIQTKDSKGVTKTRTFRWNGIVREYNIPKYVTVLRTGRLLTSTVTLTRNSARFTNSNLTDPANIPSQVVGANRRLLNADITGCSATWEDAVFNKLNRASCETTGFFSYPGVAIVLKVSSYAGPNIFQDPDRVHLGTGYDNATHSLLMTPGIAELVASACVGKKVPNVTVVDDGTNPVTVPCYSGETAQDFDLLEHSEEGFKQSFQNFGQTFQKFQLNTQNLIGNLSLAEGDFNSYARGLNQSVFTLYVQQREEADMSAAIQRAVSTVLNNHTATLSKESLDLDSLAQDTSDVANRTANNFDMIMARGIAHKAAVARVASAIYSTLSDDNDFKVRQLRAATNGLSEFVREEQLAAQRRDQLDLQTAQIHQGLNNDSMYMSKFNTRMFPFTDNIGSPPVDNENDLGPELSTVVMNNATVRYPIQLDALYGYSSRIVRRCGSSFAVSNDAPFDPSWEDLYTISARKNCSVQYTGDEVVASRCLCWYESVEERCPLYSTEWIVGFMKNGSGCASSPRAFAGGYNITNDPIVSLDAYARWWSTLAARPLAFDSDYFIHDSTTGLRTVLPYSDRLLNMTGDDLITVTAIPGSPQNLAAWKARTDTVGWQQTKNNIQPLRDRIKGMPPSWMTQRELLQQRYKDGDGQSGTTFSIMLYEPYPLTIAIPSIVSITSTVDVTVDGVTTTETGLTLDNLQDNLLDFNSLVFDPVALDQEQYDVPKRAVSYSPYPPARRFRINYAGAQNASRIGMAQYRADEGFTFNHLYAKHVAGLYRVFLETNTSHPLYGRCVDETLPSAGDWCLRRKYFHMSFAGPYDAEGNPSKMFLRDIEATAELTVQLPPSEITLQVSSTCPEIRTLVPDGNELNIELANTKPDANQFMLTQIGACATSEILTLEPGEDVTLTKQACPFAPLNQPDVLQFEYKDATTDTWIPCPLVYPLSYGPTTVDAFQGAGTLGVVHAISTRRVDAVLVMITASETKLIMAIQDNAIESLKRESQLNFKIDDSAFSALDEFQQDMQDLMRLGVQDTIAARANFTDALSGQLLIDFDARMAALEAREYDEQQADDALAAKFAADTANINVLEAEEVQVMEDDQNAAGLAVAQFGAMAIGLENAIQKDIRNIPTITWDDNTGPSPWTKIRNFFVKTLPNGFIALVKLFNPSKLLDFLKDMTSGDLKGLGQIILGLVSVIIALAVAIYRAVQLYRFFYSHTDASPAEKKLAAAIISSLGGGGGNSFASSSSSM